MRCWTRLYETDNGLLVEEHNPKGRRLFCKPGDEIADELARKYGLLPPLKEIKISEIPEDKSIKSEKIENKMIEQSKTKDFRTDNAIGITRGVVIKRQRKDTNNG